MERQTGKDIKEAVQKRYGEAAQRLTHGAGLPDGAPAKQGGCCSGSGGGCCGAAGDPITSDLYDLETARSLPADAVTASLGCGNPTALIELREGEVVLDLGSGGGIDVLLSASRVGPRGKAYGLDMTPEMLELARRNAREAGVGNVEFLEGEMEAIPLPDASVDVVISNCVVNLSADKGKVLAEAFRVLRPGGRFAVSDVVVRGEVPDELRRSMELWVGCLAGALEEREFARLLREAGFEQVSIEPTRIYRAEDARAYVEQAGIDFEAFGPRVDGRFMAAFVRGTKPAAPGR